MALYIFHSIFHLARLLYVRPETFGPYCVHCAFVGIDIVKCLSVFSSTISSYLEIHFLGINVAIIPLHLLLLTFAYERFHG